MPQESHESHVHIPWPDVPNVHILKDALKDVPDMHVLNVLQFLNAHVLNELNGPTVHVLSKPSEPSVQIEPSEQIEPILATSAGYSLHSHFEDCSMKYACTFKNLVNEWNMHEFSKKGNAHLILCQRFNLPSNVIKAIEDNNEDNGIRLGDALHHICHKDTYITRGEVVEIISNSNA